LNIRMTREKCYLPPNRIQLFWGTVSSLIAIMESSRNSEIVLQPPIGENPLSVDKTDDGNLSVNATYGRTKAAGNLSCFRGGLIEAMLKRSLSDFFEDRANSKLDKSVKEMRNKTTSLSQIIKDKVVEMGFDRTKIVVQVSIGEASKHPGLKTGVRCLWDEETDDYAVADFENDNLFCFAIVFGVRSY